ncbi:hypothetical protein CAPTEDRAFT_91948 [Capitella teleta]|uniref:Neurotransmitter-gated ion-channel ligand-binding domain-containing protein n=1 Tax=Capitella teleta TaxID=283909 RepID=R7U142_CAPTE|nr:hypothetical protein CAPTEDRAFT_91948 [Capitella teleta]|eukprot:ELT99602.1 hypothetical protein CAPTEDRAFT_91948 [Capitella teleta]
MLPSNIPLFLVWIAAILVIERCYGNHDAKRLYDDLLLKSGYNKLNRPVLNYTEAVKVKFGLKLSALNDVDEKNEIMTTTMWLMIKWFDHGLKWNKEDYGGVERIYVPSTAIWLPDVVLYNNADGDYHITIMTKATLTYTGEVEWRPPAIYKSQCDIDVEYFPFDIQICRMIFLPWSHDGTKVDMSHVKRDLYARDPCNNTENPLIEKGIDMDEFIPSQEWDVLQVPAKRRINFYPCCSYPYPDIIFDITLRRKTLFYSANIVVPCVCITLLTLTGFYVPCDCSEKISISLTILLSLSMFQLLLFDLLPGTSLKVPLLGTYILFTLFVISTSIICAVMVLNIRSRTAVSGEVPAWARWLILDMMARLMCMPQPTQEQQDQEIEDQIDWTLANCDMANFSNPYKQKFRQRKSIIQETMRSYSNHGSYFPGMDVSSNFLGVENIAATDFCEACEQIKAQKFPPNMKRAIEGVGFIVNRQKKGDANEKVSWWFFVFHKRDDWVYLAIVIDRFLLWIYLSMSFVCTCAMLLNAPALYDTRPGLKPREQSSNNVPFIFPT